MLDSLKRLVGPQPSSKSPSPDERAHTLKVATAALLFEVVRADGEVAEHERTVMRAAVQSTFDLSASEVDELIHLAEEASMRAISLYEFTQVVDAAFSEAEKKRIVELLWLVAFADQRKEPLEEHAIRKIAGLLHVSHPDFIEAKLSARGARDTAVR